MPRDIPGFYYDESSNRYFPTGNTHRLPQTRERSEIHKLQSRKASLKQSLGRIPSQYMYDTYLNTFIESVEHTRKYLNHNLFSNHLQSNLNFPVVERFDGQIIPREYESNHLLYSRKTEDSKINTFMRKTSDNSFFENPLCTNQISAEWRFNQFASSRCLLTSNQSNGISELTSIPSHITGELSRHHHQVRLFLANEYVREPEPLLFEVGCFTKDARNFIGVADECFWLIDIDYIDVLSDTILEYRISPLMHPSGNNVQTIHCPGKVSENIFIARRDGSISRISEGLLYNSCFLPFRRSACKLSASIERHSIFAQTFHGELFFFDLRYGKNPSCVFDLSDVCSMNQLECLFSLETNTVYCGIKDLSTVFALDLRKLGAPVCSWTINDTIIDGISIVSDENNYSRLTIKLPM